MKISDLQSELTKIVEEFGDLSVVAIDQRHKMVYEPEAVVVTGGKGTSSATVFTIAPKPVVEGAKGAKKL